VPHAVSNSSSLIANISHFDNEIDMAGLAKWKGIDKITTHVAKGLGDRCALACPRTAPREGCYFRDR
jgi:S-adenosylhomocysteine hydrolase